MPLYRKKPVLIEARELGRDLASAVEIVDWIVSTGGAATIVRDGDKTSLKTRLVTIRTLEGMMDALPGDHVIRGVMGEFYPCKPDVFALTYEPAP